MKANLRVICAAVGAFAALTSAPVLAQDVQTLVSELPQAGRAALQTYNAAEPNKAFAVGPQGSWAWQAGAKTLRQARILAKQRCEDGIEGQCIVVASEAGQAVSPQAQRPVGGDPGIIRMEAVPTMSPAGYEAYQTFMQADGTKAFAASPQGAWGWQASNRADLQKVAQEALARCLQHDADCSIVATSEAD